MKENWVGRMRDQDGENWVGRVIDQDGEVRENWVLREIIMRR